MRSIKELKNLPRLGKAGLKGKTVLVRVDFNVPIKNGKVLDDFRIKKALPTIKYLLAKGAKIILITHLGKDGNESLEPVIKRFSKISGLSAGKVSSVFSSLRPSPEYRGGTLGKLKNRRNFPSKTNFQVSFSENIRKFSGEMKNEPNFAKKLAKLGDIYVNEAFSVSHRAHASVVSLPKLLPSYVGLQMENEIKNLSKVSQKTKHPFLFILGGAKFSTKMPLIQKYLKLADYVFIGGALANDFLKAKGYEVGLSLVDEKNYGIKNILNSKKLILPEDVVVKSGDKLINKKADEVAKGEIILDIGKKSVKDLGELIKKSKMILWNGPLGKYEVGKAKATRETLNTLLKYKNKEIILGGGDLVNCVSKTKLSAKSYQQKANLFISTGGGATLDFLANGTLPGIKVLK